MRGHPLAKLACAPFLTAVLALAQASPCDPNLPQPKQDPYGYRLRGDRCEGVYVQDVSGAPLQVASWTQAFSEFKAGAKQPLLLEWKSGAGVANIRLRAQALRRRLYYRMDSSALDRANGFSWPTDILAALGIGKADLGVVAIGHSPLAGSDRDVYLPLRISQGGRPAHGDEYRLVLMPGVEMNELFLTLTDMTEKQSNVLKKGKPLGYGYYPAEEPIEIAISGMRGRGVYHLEIGATLKNGGASSADLWLYHPGS